jgi:hypothetical protein
MESWPDPLSAAVRGARVRRGSEDAREPAFAAEGGALVLRLPARPPAPVEGPVVIGSHAPRDRATLEVPLPERAVVHLPANWNTGVRLDRDMPAGETYQAGMRYFGVPWMAYPFALVDLGPDGWLEVAARGPLELRGQDRGGGGLFEHLTPLRPSASVERIADGFVLRFDWEATDPLEVRRWGSMEEAAANHRAWLERTFDARPLAEQVERGQRPAWVLDVPVVFTFDLWRPHGEVAHTYTHLRDFVRDLQALGVPPGALFYLPGWCGPYDLGYPDYEPVQELGGRAGFKQAIDALHDAGYRAMVHTLAWGADPYRASFDRIEHLAVRAEPHHPKNRIAGPYVGWPAGPERPYEISAQRHTPANVQPDGFGWTFDTEAFDQPFEAMLTLGGLDWVGDGVVCVTVNHRSLWSPAGAFRSGDSYRFPLRLLFRHGVNQVGLQFYGAPRNVGGGGGSAPDLSGVWYSFDDAAQFGGVWTAPIVGMKTDEPAWHQAFAEKLAPAVEEFGIDAVHVDASLIWRWDEAGFFPALQRRLPKTVFGSESCTSAGMRFFTFSQNGLVSTNDRRGEWASKPSDVSWLVTREYMRVYQHLCSPRGFVPVGTSCNISRVPDSLPEGEAERLRATLLRSRELHLLYNLRVNYRDYGLDDGTRAFLLEHVVQRG